MKKILTLQLLTLLFTATAACARKLPPIIEPELVELQPRQQPKRQ